MLKDETAYGGPSRVGPYRIERLVGSGGMGMVFLAVREDDFEQRVALKVVGHGLNSEEILARFYNERQILAHLEHPGIARILDGGVTEDGRPYFAMQFVEGERIDRYCDQHDLDLRQRLELFCKVCDVVQFAHQNLVVHRDIKAGNILVSEDGTPCLLDFGIAKVLDPQRTPQPLETATGLSPMTPAYASPEQVLQEPITTASDVYSLGILLYRLLVGHPPYNLEGRSLAEMIDVICRQEPERPSLSVGREQVPWSDERPTEFTRIGEGDEVEVSKDAPTLPERTLQRRRKDLSGDLDAIVLRALRKEPPLRYGSAASLAEDIRRHLQGLPVLARQGSGIYHLEKFVRRHKILLGVMLLILAFAITSTVLWREAVQERIQAKEQQARSERVIDFLESLFKDAHPDVTQGKEMTVLELLARGRDRVHRVLVEDPELQAELLGTLGTVHGDLGLYDEAEELKREALIVRRQNDSRDRPGLAKDINGLASQLYSQGDYEEAERLFREALAMRKRLGQKDRRAGGRKDDGCTQRQTRGSG